ncbi:MAG: tetratricopeptide repeat protein [Planctomycetes bacterium]|nr:tetratricopeptide repeat protein [Planctomycetota bacterium]
MIVRRLLLTGLTGLAGIAALPAQAPTWANGVAELVHRSCTPCHRPGQPAPFSLRTYDDVQKRSGFVLEVVEDRYMPPWQPSHGVFVGDRRLSDEQIATLKAWVEAGAPRGDREREPAPPEFASGWQLGEPDLVVRMPDVLTVPADGPDVVRNFVVPVDVDRLRFVAALEIRPGNRAVHHAVLGVDRTRASRLADARDEAPGFPGMTLGAAGPPDGHFLGWTPGKSVRRNPKGMSWRLHPGDDFVLQLHAVPVGKAERVQPEIGIWFTDEPMRQPYELVMLFSEEIDIAPGDDAFVLRDHLVLPVPVTLHAIYPHAHYVCRRMRATATLPDGEVRTLFAIDDWDFDWQDDYRYREPMRLPAGTRVAMEYGYDNSEANDDNPNRPPQRVRFGQESRDEMGTLTLSVTVRSPQERDSLQLASVERDLEKLPRAWNLLMRKAQLLRARRDFAAAQRAIDRACQISPGSPDVWFERGLLAEFRQQPEQAERDYQRALRVDPNHAMAHMQLGTMCGRRGDDAGALRHFAAAVEALPNSPAAHQNFATANFAGGRLDVAERHYRRAIALDPTYFHAQLNLGRVLMAAGNEAEARRALERAAELRPGQQVVRDLLRRLKD